MKTKTVKGSPTTDRWLNEIDLEITSIENDPETDNLSHRKASVSVLKILRKTINEIIKIDGYHHMSMMEIASFLFSFAYQKPISEIKDLDSEWILKPNHDDHMMIYQSIRCPSLSKYVNLITGEVTYSDSDRIQCYGVASFPIYGFFSVLTNSIINEMFPITMPYLPNPFGEKIRVIVDGHLYNYKNDSFDTVAILYCMHPYGIRREINRYFKMSEKPRFGWIQIGKFEYLWRKFFKISYERQGRIRQKMFKRQPKIVDKKKKDAEQEFFKNQPSGCVGTIPIPEGMFTNNGTKCSHCDSVHEDPDCHEHVVTYYADGKLYFTEIIRPSSLSNIEFGKDSRKE